MPILFPEDRLVAKMGAYKRHIDEARKILREVLPNPRAYVAVSGGKDSGLALALAREVDPKIPAVWYPSGAEFPETEENIRALSQHWRLPVLKIHPKRSILELWASDEPENFSRELIIEPAERLAAEYGLDVTIWGLRADENSRRARLLYSRGPDYTTQDGLRRITPLYRLSTREVWAATWETAVPISRLYDAPSYEDRNAIRTGSFAGTTYMRYGRLAQLKRTHPDLFKRFAKSADWVRAFT